MLNANKKSNNLLSYNRRHKSTNDECYTPDYGVTPILEFIHKDWIVWCPFDTENSEFVKQIHANGNRVIYSHIDDGKNFFNYEPKEWDCIVSNPPFTNKRKFFERALSFNKPFALLMSATWLNDSAPAKLFSNINLQLLLFNKRIHFLNNGETNKNTTFASIYFCSNFLDKQIIFKNL